MQSNSNKEDLGWSGCASPSLPLLRCSWVACSQRQCCSPASQVGRGEKIESDWKRITSFSLQTEQCTGSPSWCSVQVLSQLLMCKGWIKIIPKLLQNCLNVIPKLSQSCVQIVRSGVQKLFMLFLSGAKWFLSGHKMSWVSVFELAEVAGIASRPIYNLSLGFMLFSEKVWMVVRCLVSNRSGWL